MPHPKMYTPKNVNIQKCTHPKFFFPSSFLLFVVTAPHTDWGSISIVIQNDVGGLQVWDKAEKAWENASPVPGALIVNTGNLMQRWTNDLYISNMHQVKKKKNTICTPKKKKEIFW